MQPLYLFFPAYRYRGCICLYIYLYVALQNRHYRVDCLYTLPSDLEGMPLSLLEAMSYGNCCLTSDIPECTEVVEDKALIFKKSDVDDLKNCLQDACDHQEKVWELKKQASDNICEK